LIGNGCRAAFACALRQDEAVNSRAEDLGNETRHTLTSLAAIGSTAPETVLQEQRMVLAQLQREIGEVGRAARAQGLSDEAIRKALALRPDESFPDGTNL
jgi:hypothetical protein